MVRAGKYSQIQTSKLHVRSIAESFAVNYISLCYLADEVPLGYAVAASSWYLHPKIKEIVAIS